MYASIIILIGMSFQTQTFKGAFWLRLLNIIGSIVFVVYGLILPAYSTAFLNACLVFVNGYHLIVLLKKNRSQNKH